MDEKTLSTKTVFSGRMFRLELVDVELENGTRTEREIIRHSGATVVLARLPDGRFLFVRQFRKPVEQEVLEAVAGTLEPGEDPEVCARREVAEETGHTVEKIVHLGTVYPSPGYIEERMQFYFAEVSAESGSMKHDEDEHTVPVIMTRDEVEEAICSGELFDAKSLALWLLYEKKVEAKARA